MDNIKDFIITCESLMIGEDEIAMENLTTVDVIKIVNDYKDELKKNYVDMKVYKKKNNFDKYIKSVDERIDILQKLKKEIGGVEESVFRNISASILTLGIFVGVKVGTNIGITKIKKDLDYQKKFGGNMTKTLFFDQYASEIEYWEFIKKHADKSEWEEYSKK